MESQHSSDLRRVVGELKIIDFSFVSFFLFFLSGVAALKRPAPSGGGAQDHGRRAPDDDEVRAQVIEGSFVIDIGLFCHRDRALLSYR